MVDVKGAEDTENQKPDDSNPSADFPMPATRTALEHAPQADRIAQLLDVIENVPRSDPELVFDACRALIESVCSTILADLGEDPPAKPNAEKMVPLVLKRLRVFLDPMSVEGAARRAAGDTVKGVNKLVNGIGIYRRNFGRLSHGKDGYRDSLDVSHARLVVGVTDSLAAFLFVTHRRLHGQEEWQRAVLGDHPEFDRFLDDEHDPSPILVFGDEVSPSRVLFSVNRSGYIKRLNDWRRMLASGEIQEEAEE